MSFYQYQYLSNMLYYSSFHAVWLRIFLLCACLGFGIPAVALQRIDEKTLGITEHEIDISDITSYLMTE